MAKIYVDLEFAKQFALTEKDFSGKTEEEQEKILDDGYKKFKKVHALRSETELFESANTAVPKIFELFEKPSLVWAKPKPPEKSPSKILLVGGIPSKNIILAIKPDSESSKIKILQYQRSDIILSADDLLEKK